MTDSGNWAGNGLRFAAKEEAEMYVARFSSARSTRVIEAFEPVNYRWEDGRLVVRNSRPLGTLSPNSSADFWIGENFPDNILHDVKQCDTYSQEQIGNSTHRSLRPE
jgi:hypothetical protein